LYRCTRHNTRSLPMSTSAPAPDFSNFERLRIAARQHHHRTLRPSFPHTRPRPLHLPTIPTTSISNFGLHYLRTPSSLRALTSPIPLTTPRLFLPCMLPRWLPHLPDSATAANRATGTCSTHPTWPADGPPSHQHPPSPCRHLSRASRRNPRLPPPLHPPTLRHPPHPSPPTSLSHPRPPPPSQPHPPRHAPHATPAVPFRTPPPPRLLPHPPPPTARLSRRVRAHDGRPDIRSTPPPPLHTPGSATASA
jgi:hypothetical protein